MILLRRLTFALVVLLAIATAVFWWNRPQAVDMSANAPADSLVYLEASSVPKIATALTTTDAWRKLAPLLQLNSPAPLSWWARFVGWTGLGPVRTVVATRAQIAVVVLDLAASEERENLKVKPDAAIVIETHTASWRIKPAAEELLGQLAKASYGSPSFSKQTTGGLEYLIWRSPAGPRQIVATVDDTALLIGNSEAAVNTCLAVRRGERPSLKDAPELQRMRRALKAEQALAFGYVSSANTGRLVSVAAPLWLGRETGESGIQKLAASAASKLIGSIGWSSFASNGGIEDRYQFSLQPLAMSRLKPAFRPTTNEDKTIVRIVDEVYSLTLYRFDSPSDAWSGFESAVLSQLDAVSAVVFRSVLKATVLNYGVEDPEAFLRLVGSNVATVRLSPNAERSVLIVQMRDRGALYEHLSKVAGEKTTQGGAEILQSKDNELSAAFSGDHLLLGPPAEVRDCLEKVNSPTDQVRASYPTLPSATIVTYTDDSERVRSFIHALNRSRSNSGSSQRTADFENAIDALPYAVTETILNDDGLERRTHSSFGQFGALVTLLLAN